MPSSKRFEMVLLVSSLWLCASRAGAQPADGGREVLPVIPSGQDALVAEMMNPPGGALGCRLDHASIEQTRLIAHYRCAPRAALVTIEGRHPGDAPAAALRTERFALIPGDGTPPELFSTIAAQVRAKEGRWRWVRPLVTAPPVIAGSGLTPSQDQQYRAGLEQYRAGRYAEALATYVALAGQNACCGVLGMLVASLASTTPTPDTASRYAAEAEAAPTDPLKQFVAGVAEHYAAHQMGRTPEEKEQLYARTIQHLERALAAFEREPRVFIYLAISHFRLGHQREAETFIERAVGLGNDDPDAYYCRAEIFQRTNIQRSILDIDRYLSMMATLERQGAVADAGKTARVRAMRAHLVEVSRGRASPQEIFDPVSTADTGVTPPAPRPPGGHATSGVRPSGPTHPDRARWSRRVGLGVVLAGAVAAVLRSLRRRAPGATRP